MRKYLEIDLKDKSVDCIEKRYWNLAEKVDSKPFELKEFWNILQEAVSLRLNADVPVANFLSGGIDSSAITSLANDSNRSKKIG